MSGDCETGSTVEATAPAIVTMIERTLAKSGRSRKNRENLCMVVRDQRVELAGGALLSAFAGGVPGAGAAAPGAGPCGAAPGACGCTGAPGRSFIRLSTITGSP